MQQFSATRTQAKARDYIHSDSVVPVLGIRTAFPTWIWFAAHESFPQHPVELFRRNTIGIGEIKADSGLCPVLSVVLRFDIPTTRELDAKRGNRLRELSGLENRRCFSYEGPLAR